MNDLDQSWTVGINVTNEKGQLEFNLPMKGQDKFNTDQWELK